MKKRTAEQETALVAAAAVDLRVVVGKLRRRLREQAQADDFTPSQIAVLAHLERFGPSTVTDIAAAEGVRPQSMGATVATLESAGVVGGTPDPGDGRRTILALTPAAPEWIDSNRAAKEDWLFRAIQTNFDAAEREQLAVGIELLKRLIKS